MRVEPFGIDSYVHVVKRGARGLPITGDDADKLRFLDLLFYMNDEFLDENWHLAPRHGAFFRPASWPERVPLVSVVAYTLMSNHLHLVLREVQEGGTSAFMQKIGQSMTNHFNEKYDQRGSLFQGSYRSRTVQDDDYLRYVCAYVMVKNVFELYPKGGLRAAAKRFEHAWEWGISYPFSSLGEYGSAKQSGILGNGVCSDAFSSPQEFKRFARDVIEGGTWAKGEYE